MKQCTMKGSLVAMGLRENAQTLQLYTRLSNLKPS